MLGNTYIDPEELAYNVPLWRSPRRGRVLLPSGKVGKVRLGIPDTWFTVPAVARFDGRRWRGFVSWDDVTLAYRFTVARRYNHPSNPCPGDSRRGCDHCRPEA